VVLTSKPCQLETDLGNSQSQFHFEPLTPELVEKVIAKERLTAADDVGGQLLLISPALAARTALEKYGGVNWSRYQQIEKRKIVNRLEAMDRIGVDVCPCG